MYYLMILRWCYYRSSNSSVKVSKQTPNRCRDVRQWKSINKSGMKSRKSWEMFVKFIRILEKTRQVSNLLQDLWNEFLFVSKRVEKLPKEGSPLSGSLKTVQKCCKFIGGKCVKKCFSFFLLTGNRNGQIYCEIDVENLVYLNEKNRLWSILKGKLPTRSFFAF